MDHLNLADKTTTFCRDMFTSPDTLEFHQVNKQQEAANAMASGSAAPAQDTYRPYYPSMDPSAQGNAPLQGERPDERSIPK